MVSVRFNFLAAIMDFIFCIFLSLFRSFAERNASSLAGVLGMLDLLRLTALTPEQAGLVRVMQGSAEGLMQVLNEILDFSKIQSGHLALDNVDFHIGGLLEQVNDYM